VKEAEGEAERDGDGHVEEELAEAGDPVARAEAEVVADSGETADGEEGVEACIEESELTEDGEPGRPGGLEPAQIDGEPKREKDKEVEEMAALAGIEAGGKEFEAGEEDGDAEVHKEPARGEDVRTKRVDEVRDDENGGEYEAQSGGKGLCGAGTAVAGKSEGEKGDEKQNEGESGGKDGERGVHGRLVIMVAGGWREREAEPKDTQL
jgi:hypothetical protein